MSSRYSYDVDSCRDVRVVVSNLISSVEIIRCKKIQVQVTGWVPCFHLDCVDGCTIFLSEEGKSCQFATSKISEINVSYPDGENRIKVPIPEQYTHVINGDKIDTKVSELYGSG